MPAMRYVLFVCTHNAGRSQMAQAFFEQFAPLDIRAESGGNDPRAEIWPNVVEAMREVDIDLADRRPKKLTLEMQLHADWGVTLACGGTCPYVPATVEEWDVPDPAGLTVAETRPIRDQIQELARELAEDRVDAIRSDRTAHELRLQALLPDLSREFSGIRPADQVRACADRILLEYSDVPIRSHVRTLAHRRIRDCLLADECAAVA